MSALIVGFDLGSLTSYVVVAQQNGLVSVANEFSERNTPTCVSFNDKMRYVGQEAKCRQNSNVKNTLCCFNRFIGKTVHDPNIHHEAKRQLCEIVEAEDHRVGFEVSYLGKRQIFSAEQLYAMQLTKMKEVAEMNLNTKVVDVVINVPTNATDCERQAVLDAAKIANLNCVQIMNDTTSAALAYRYHRQDFTDERPTIVAFVDMGYANLQSALVEFGRDKMRVIASACDNIGGRDFDQAIYDHIKGDFKQRYKLYVEDNTKSGIRLMQECENLKKLMSVNSKAIPMNIECFMNDVDVSTEIQRAELDSLASHTLNRVRSTLLRLLKDAGLKTDEINSVEIVGGSTRVAAVKNIITDVFKQPIRTSLNADEAVAKGCAIQCGMLASTMQSKKFQIIDVNSYSICLRYSDKKGNEQVEVFPQWSQYQNPKIITFKRSTSFKLDAVYGRCNELPIGGTILGVFNVTGVNANLTNKTVKVNVTMDINANGIFTCCGAQQVDNIENTNPGIKSIDLNVLATNRQYTSKKIGILNEAENEMIMQTKLEKEKLLAKNSVLEYVYEMMLKLCGEFEEFLNDTEREIFLSEFVAAENWIDEDGADATYQVYADKLAHLQLMSNVIIIRATGSME